MRVCRRPPTVDSNGRGSNRRLGIAENCLPSKSIAPLWSTSTSLIMSCSSESDGFWPSERMMSPSSLAVMLPVKRRHAAC